MRNFFSLVLSRRIPLRKYLGGFTLVELIVVITILAVLSAIGLVSFSSFNSGARDSTRVEDLTNMQKSLAISATTSVNGKYPTPDNGVQILNGGVLMNTQGYAWKTTLSTIRFNGAGLDPLDGQYYTYSVNKTQTWFALLAYLENTSNLTLTSYIEKSFAAATTDYSARFPAVTGNPIGVFIASWSLQPVQASASTSVDIATATTSAFVAYIAPKVTVAGNGGATFAGNVVTATAPSSSSSLVSGACTGLPANAVYYGTGTTYTITGAVVGTSLVANYNALPTTNTCQFACATGAGWTGTGCVVGLDPYALNVVTLLHFDGSMIDDTGKIWTAAGSAVTSVTQKKFGSASLALDGVGSTNVSTPNSTDFDFGNADFVIDWWEYATATDGYRFQRQQQISGSSTARVHIYGSSGNMGVEIQSSTDSDAGGQWAITSWGGLSAGSIPLNTWTHWALFRNGTNIYMAKNGAITLTINAGTTAIRAGTGSPLIKGQQNDGYGAWFAGYIDEFRITKGSSRGWTGAGFTPPTAPTAIH